jgi:hypothetical protein
VIQGKTASGRTELTVLVGDIDGFIRSVKLTIDGKSYHTVDAESFDQVVIRDPANGVYVLSLNAEGRRFRLWMVPGTEKIIQQGSGVYRSRFGAILEATDPRQEQGGELTPRITIGCTLDWSI